LIWLFPSSDMSVIALPGLIVIAYEALAATTEVKTILQAMTAVCRWLRQTPDDQLDDGAIGSHDLFMEKQRCPCGFYCHMAYYTIPRGKNPA